MRRVVTKLFLLLVAIFLSWRLLRFADPSTLFWQFHLFILCVLILISLPSFFQLDRWAKSSMGGLFFAFIILILLRESIFLTPSSFTIGTLCFFIYFLLERSFRKVNTYDFFSYFQFLLVLLLVFNSVDFVNWHLLEKPIFDYSNAMSRIDAIHEVGKTSRTFLPGFVGRPPGVSGTPYASSALIAATAIFFCVLGKKKLFIFASFLMILWATGGPIAAYILALFLLNIRNIRKWYSPLVVILLFMFTFYVYEHRNGFHAGWLGLGTDHSPTQLILAFLVGDYGTFSTEFGFLKWTMGLGIFGLVIFVAMVSKYWKVIDRMKNSCEYIYFRAGFWFMFTIIFSSWHYHTLFLFPNIIFLVLLLAFVSSRIVVPNKRARLQENFLGRCKRGI